MRPRYSELSRAVSHALRHEPWLYELELDDDGWVPVDSLLAALRLRGGEWTDIDRTMLEHMIADSSKRRHELIDDRIRALYGHSIPGRLAKEPGVPPDELFHGTSSAAWLVIEREGLRPTGRQYVHLSIDRAMAEQVGRRKASDPQLVGVDAATASAAGVVFYVGNEQVWLADFVPAAFLVPID